MTSITTLLIANRGEIAIRVARTARQMGVATVAVYSDADRDSPHVRACDMAIGIGGLTPADSYLVADKIIEAARRAGAQAIHPGYGFLSENAGFAARVAAEGLVFVGPPAAAIEAMGDKARARRRMAAAGIPVVPGYDGEDQSHDLLLGEAERIGFPIMIKASAGGGGRGMRRIDSAAAMPDALKGAASEAQKAFGDGRLILERAVIEPRHVEIQVFADRHGNVVHLGERDCSVQRRHQKVIEEAPSPLLDEATRRKMGEQAVALAKAVGYDSAGTVEFVAGQDRSFYFLEMNTRLQVEHPVTELVTGIDLVEQMIRVAAGEVLSIKQSDVKLVGWAVESRVYAEDPYRGFLPSTGRLVRYRPPAEMQKDGITVRNDTGVYEGGEISLFYDPMIAKLVTHGPDRTAAIDAQADALDAFYIDGIRHNIPFLSALMAHPRWRSGMLSTGFIAEEFPDGFHGVAPEGEAAHVLAAVASAVDHVLGERKRQISGQMPHRLVMRERQRAVWLNETEYKLDVTRTNGAIEVAFRNGDAHIHKLQSDWKPGDPVWFGTVDGKRVAVQVTPVPNGFDVAYRGAQARAYVYTESEAAYARLMPVKKAADTGKSLLCPMPGLVVSIAVAEGQEVKAGETLAVVEAMKMENVLRAERDGTVKKIHAKKGDSLAVDAVIMEFA